MQSHSIKKATPWNKSWKIWLPLSACLILVVALAVMFGIMSVSDQAAFSLWAIIAMIILIFLSLLGNFIILIFIVLSAMAVKPLHRKTSEFISKVQTRSSTINHLLRNASKTVLKPFSWFDQLGAILSAVFRKK